MKQARQFGFPMWVVAAAIGLAACGERVDSGQPARESQAAPRAMQGDQPMDSTRDASATPAMPGTAERDNAAGGTSGSQSAVALGEAVKTQLARDPQLGAAPIEVEVAGGGQIALKGSAPTASARERAAQLAWTVKGVTKVDNQLTVVGS